MTTRKSAGIFQDINRIVNTFCVIWSPLDFIKHPLEFFRFTPFAFHNFLNFFHDSYRPYKFRLSTIDTIQNLLKSYSSRSIQFSFYLDYLLHPDKVLNRRRRRAVIIRSAFSDNGLIDLHVKSPYSIGFRQ